MRVFKVAMLAGLMMVPLTAPVFAQFTPGFRLNEEKTLTPEEIERNKANEAAAKEARSKIPDAKASSDPWASVRSEPAPKAPHKTKTPAK